MKNWNRNPLSPAKNLYGILSRKNVALSLFAAGVALFFHHRLAHASAIHTDSSSGIDTTVHTPWADSVKKHFSTTQSGTDALLNDDALAPSHNNSENLSEAIQNSSWSQTGQASWYSGRFPHGKQQLTAAHRTLPLGTKVVVHSQDTGRSIIVTITDRGPYIRGRIIDLSRNAAIKLGLLRQGTGHVVVSKINPKSMPVEVAEAPER